MADRLRIGLLTHSVNPRGGVVHTVELAQALHALGHDVTVFAPAGPGQTFCSPGRWPVTSSAVPVSGDTDGVAGMAAQRIDAFVRHLAPRRRVQTPFDLLHAQDGLGGERAGHAAQSGACSPASCAPCTTSIPTPTNASPPGSCAGACWRAAGTVLCVSDLLAAHPARRMRVWPPAA
jgi:hypothetical protein